MEPAEELDLVDDAQWENLKVTGDFSHRKAGLVEIAGCRFSGARLTGTEIARLILTDCVFEDCELSGTIVGDLAASRVEFRRSRMSAFAAAAGRFENSSFIQCRLDRANFRMTIWKAAQFVDSHIVDADFYESKLGGARFTGCDLTKVDFSNAQMKGVDLRGSTIDDIRGGDSLRGVVISSDQIVSISSAVLAALEIRIDPPEN